MGETMSASETPFDLVHAPGAASIYAVRVSVLAHVLGTHDEPAGFEVLRDGRPTGVEAFSTTWDPELSLVEVVAADDASRLSVRAIGDSVVLKAVARPFQDPTGRSNGPEQPKTARRGWGGSRRLPNRES